jgi:hypothetical protein
MNLPVTSNNIQSGSLAASGLAAAPRLESMFSNALAQAGTAATGSEDHKLGLGVRLGGYGFGL